MQLSTLNHLPKEIIYLIAQKLDFESHREISQVMENTGFKRYASFNTWSAI